MKKIIYTIGLIVSIMVLVTIGVLLVDFLIKIGVYTLWLMLTYPIPFFIFTAIPSGVFLALNWNKSINL